MADDGKPGRAADVAGGDQLRDLGAHGDVLADDLGLLLARHVLGPRDLQERNANLLGGDVGGGSYRLRQLLFRPVPAPNPYRTPLRGLYIGSAATFPGGAVHGVGGDAAARAALADTAGDGRAAPAPAGPPPAQLAGR